MTILQDFELTSSEQAAIEEMAKRFSKDLPRKFYNEYHLYYRYLRARDFDVDAADKMLRQSLQWREDNNMDSLLTEYKPSELLADFTKNYHFGYSKDGYPVYYAAGGNQDTRGLIMSARYPDIEKAFAYVFEEIESTVENQSKKLNKSLDGIVLIFNMDGLTFGKATYKKGLEVGMKLFKMFMDYYPERLKVMYIINANALFKIPFNIAKSLFSARMLSKIHIYDKDEWKEILLQKIDADQLPMFLGGTRTDPDGNPLCKTFINHGGKVDEKYYMHRSTHSLEKSPGVKMITLPRASFNEVFVKIEESGSFIEWEFETKTRDIAFGLFYREVDREEENMIELVELQRLETNDFSEVGMYKCDKRGEYVILFDNSYSWIRSKNVYYRINVVKPSELEKKISD